MRETSKITISATVINDVGALLPYTTQSTKEQCEEFSAGFFIRWDTLKSLGSRVVQTAIINVEDLTYEEAAEALRTFYGKK